MALDEKVTRLAATDVTTFKSRVESRGTLAQVDQYMIDMIASTGATPAREAALYHLNTGGSRMRAQLGLASATVRLNTNDAIAAAAACELLHNASLVHDDISDGDLLRRGALTVRSAYGAGIALCTGDLLFSAAFHAASDITDPMTSLHLTRSMAQAAARVIGGQSIELAHEKATDIPTRHEYLMATRAKTAPLIELPISVGLLDEATDSAARQRCTALAQAIGLAYQILDDLDDLPPFAADATAPQPHGLHAWWHHQPMAATPNHERTIARCLWHANAALTRANRLAASLPTPLNRCVDTLIDKLTSKAQREPTY